MFVRPWHAVNMSPTAVVCVAEANLRALFSLLLVDAGALVVVAHDLDEAEQLLGARQCELCVISQRGEEALAEFFRTARKLAPQARHLLLAHREDVDGVLSLFSAGLSEALLQPINPKRAVAAIGRLLGRGKISAPVPLEIGSVPPMTTDAGYRPSHLVVRSSSMRRLISDLWAARSDPVGVILRGEAGVEFELAAREYQAMGGDTDGTLVVLNNVELDVETLATQLSLDRLHDGVPRTYFLSDVEKLEKNREKPLLEFLRRARRQRDREKPLRIVFAAHSSDERNVAADSEFLEELQFIVPAVVTIPPMRDRVEDVPQIARQVLAGMTALNPELRARSIHPAALQWLSARTWRGNYRELSAVLRQAILDCPNRELSPLHFGRLTETLGDPEEAAAARVLAAVQRATTK